MTASGWSEAARVAYRAAARAAAAWTDAAAAWDAWVEADTRAEAEEVT